ncbi:MAG: 50S ribosomal protein L19 [Deltaproteobacteria bacterium CG_4_10_14_0_2_um_filter_43_8]|nr:MAG: 50S ribosomal protein L19 [Deltaproteobacteria bacterium CG11_big_fil_rev_8_21_14_0_20_42_23]PJA21659.1 MAG: 50S ribosomal protein L19 [Deltaproteobacteria bacterium CG_4_10_14_0_2_um_filter_43_8]PJC64291.1 MAG: 50S ribosomal protein L19 [Deltaproteobacteria bacterium CG_4_9_14_0_2_um_filter_42_21]
MHILEKLKQENLRPGTPDLRPGDTVRVHCKIKEGDKQRTQVYEGVVISRRRAGSLSTITVRKISFGVGVERVFSVHSPLIEKLEFVNRGRVRRSKLFYLRDLRGKAARIREKRLDNLEGLVFADEDNAVEEVEATSGAEA